MYGWLGGANQLSIKLSHYSSITGSAPSQPSELLYFNLHPFSLSQLFTCTRMLQLTTFQSKSSWLSLFLPLRSSHLEAAFSHRVGALKLSLNYYYYRRMRYGAADGVCYVDPASWRDIWYNIHACVVGCRNRRTTFSCAAATTVTYTCVIRYY